MAPEVAVVLEGYTYFECPRWHENRIWVSDFYTYQVISACEDGTDIRVEAEVPGQPSGLGWLPDGRLLVVSMRDQKILRRESDGELVVHADLSGYVSANVNDMLVDAQGRAYVGNFGFDLMNLAPVETADLLRVDPDGSVHVVARDLHFPNGMALTSTGDLLVDETLEIESVRLPSRPTALWVNAATGRRSGRCLVDPRWRPPSLRSSLRRTGVVSTETIRCGWPMPSEAVFFMWAPAGR